MGGGVYLPDIDNTNKPNTVMIKKPFDYQTPECDIMDILVENVLCTSSDEEGYTIEDYEKELIGW